MLTAENTRKISRISREEVDNKKAKIEQPIRTTRITRSRSNDVIQAPEILPKSTIRRSPRQSLSGSETAKVAKIERTQKAEKDEVKSSKSTPVKVTKAESKKIGRAHV